ncbi:class I SAM-dependent methyltransferase [Campylobacter sp. RM12640]|uniref:class I SAM-dependent methyltransferase n=1 Tax=unclassified Campylobacter TaxID=2593542 RepID=UPI0030155FCC|nr:class I SAM-dependent methyltransferase [Campylobacter sp. RM12640]MBZ7989861.1 class I SAM-dependent methyltransferase [Campylobacter sp. RM12635]
MLKANNLSKISFKNLYIEQKNLSDFKSKNASEWDKKAQSFNDYAKHEAYVREFLKQVDFSGCDSLLDFACGSAFLAKHSLINNITLCDFSPKMLEFAKINCPNARIIQGSYDDLDGSWDLVFASRCLDVNDLAKALQILLNCTKKRLYFTYKIDNSYIHEKIINALDLDIIATPNYIYAANILNELGYFFTLNKITIKNQNYYKTYEDLQKSVEFSYKKLNDIQIEKLKNLYENDKDLIKQELSWALFCVEK